MSFDPWRQWQAFTAAFTPPAAPPAGAAFAPFTQAADRFAGAAREFYDSAARDPAQAGAAAMRFGEFLRDQFAGLQMPWSSAPATAPGAMPFDAPALGPAREHQQRAQRMAAAWSRIDEAQRRLQRLWTDTLREASMAFTARLSQQPGTPDAQGLRRLYDAWIDCAEEAWSRTAHSEAFCKALADHVNASAEWRAELQAGVEQWAKLADLPTRSEVNTLARRLKAVEEQLRQKAAPAARPRARKAPASKAPARKAPARKGR